MPEEQQSEHEAQQDEDANPSSEDLTKEPGTSQKPMVGSEAQQDQPGPLAAGHYDGQEDLEGRPVVYDRQDSENKPVVAEPALPPEAQGEANGGPLGCCLGVMIGLLLSLSVAILSRVYSEPLGHLFQSNYQLLGILVRILMGLLAVAFAILCGYWGWKLGRRFFREYEPPEVKQRGRKRKARPV